MKVRKPIQYVVAPTRSAVQAFIERHPLAVVVLFALSIGSLISWALIAHLENDDTRDAQLVIMKKRAEVAEQQVQEIARIGDCGILLARVNTVDLGMAELRIRPAGVR